MGLKVSGLQARAEKRRKLSRNQVAARDRLRLERAAQADAWMEIVEAEEWARNNSPPKLPPAAKIRIQIPGLPARIITVRRWPDGKILAGNQLTTPKQFGRTIGVLLDQFL